MRIILHTRFSADDIRDMFTNPIYVGIGPYDASIGEETWLDVNVRMIKEEGAKLIIKSIQKKFKDTFTYIGTLDTELYIDQAQHNPRAALIHLLTNMRDLTQEKSK